jgi:oligopeptide transport system ATP-binding protein
MENFKASNPEVLMRVQGLSKHFPVKKGFLKRTVGHVKAVEQINLEIYRGETLGLVGESGCGKSTLGRTMIRLYEPTQGSVEFKGQDFLKLDGASLRKNRRQVQMIFQDPYASLDPRMTVGQILQQPLDVHGIGTLDERKRRVLELLSTVGLKPAHVNRYPHEFSGGQRQRISIARALALNPELIICDEPVSALDVSIQAQILNLLKDLQEQLKLTYLFISHDLSVIEYFCNRVAVMYLGRIVEIGTRDELFQNPTHPYTKALLQAIPQSGVGKRQVTRSLGGDVPSPLHPPSGCAFHPRCSSAIDSCSKEVPILRGESHQWACPVAQNGRSFNNDSNLKNLSFESFLGPKSK